ncbi:MAG: DUF362 domain-containing protein [Chitinispirillaceae bacterium]|nr:DUF362 domain-containing protein [Chitinispirillaceae bacterium]
MIRFMMIVVALCSILHAEDVVLSGTVKSTDGKSLEGVKVTLAKLNNLSAVTNTDGAFTLSNVTNVLLPNDLKTSYGLTFRNNTIVFSSVSEKVSGKLSLYSINGRLITSVTLDNLPVGERALALPSRLSSGSYLLAGIINGKSFTRSLICTGNEQLKSKDAPEKVEGTRSFTMKKRVAKTVADTLIFSKDGYITQRWPLNRLSRENIRMVLRAPGEKPVVYMTKKLGPEGFLAIYEAIGYDLPGEIMVKVHNGEPGGKYFISSGRMASLVNQVNGTIVETCLGFSMEGSVVRDTPARNLQVSKDHGFDTIGQGVDILDTDGEITLPVKGGSQLKGSIDVGANFKNYQSSLVISHFKGHGIAGFGGAIKNVSFGFASPNGKRWIHSGGEQKKTFSFLQGDKFQKGMVEASKAVHDALEGNLVYINTVDNLVLECDCDANMGKGQGNPLMDDIGMLGSLDPIAIDQASCDLVLAASGGQALKDRIKSTQFKGLDGLKYGQEIGLGKIEYELVDIDK